MAAFRGKTGAGSSCPSGRPRISGPMRRLTPAEGPDPGAAAGCTIDGMHPSQRQRTTLRWAAASAGALLVLALLFPLLAPRIMDLESVRGRIESALSDAIGGTVTFDRLDVALLPRPGATVRSLRISVPGSFEGTAESLSIHPKILPLFIGKLRLAQVTAEAPDLTVRFAAEPARDAKAKRPSTLAAFKRSIGDAGARLASLAPSLSVVIRRGRMVLSFAEQPPIAIERLDARVVLPPRGFAVSLTCGTSFWRHLALDAELDPRTLTAEGSLEVEGLRPHLLDPYFYPEGASPLGDSLVDLDLSFRTDGETSFRAQGSGSAPRLRLLRGGSTLLIERARFKGRFDLDERQRVFILDDLEAASPRLALQGEVRQEPAIPRTGMTVTGRNIDIQALRHAVLFFAEDQRPVQLIFNVLQAGEVPAITFTSSGAAPSDLVDLRQMRITAGVQNGSIDIPGTALHLTGVSGKMVIAGGVLEAEGLSARMGRTTGQQGTLRLGLRGGEAPFHLDMMLQADLAELPPVLKSFLRDPAVIGELDLLRDVRGSARGRLILGEKLRSMRVTADVSSFELSAGHQRVPFPVRVSGGRFLLAGSRIFLERVHGMLGNSAIKELTARADLADPAHIEITSADAALHLNELFPWLSSFPAIERALKGVEAVQGTVRIAVQRALIPLAEPGSLQFAAAGSLNAVAISGKDLPGPVLISRGTFTANQEMLAFTNVDATALDADLHLDGRLQPAQTSELTATGTVGEKAFRWLSQKLGIPPEFALRTPVSLPSLRVSWHGRDTLTCTGVMAFPMGPSVALDLLRSPETLAFHTLQIRDGNDEVGGRLKFEHRVLDFAIAGTLRDGTLTKIFANERLPHGSLSGKFEAHVLLDRPRESTARGTLTGERLPVPLGWTSPVTIDRIALRADGSMITVDASNITVGDMHVVFTGTASASADGYSVNGDLSADRIVLDALLAATDKDHAGNAGGARKNTSPPAERKDLPLRGTVRFRANTITSGRLSASPVLGDISFSGSGFRAAITEAALCGLSVTGAAAVMGNEISVDLRAAAAEQQLESTMACLSQDNIRTTGVFDLMLHLTAKGRNEDLIKTLGGTVEFSAKNGRIDRAENLMRTLALLNITELLRGKMPDLRKEGITYNAMKLRGVVRDGTVQISEAVLDGSVITISGGGSVDLPSKSVDAVLLVAPFKTFDAIINAIPGVRYIMGGNLIAVPVRLRGPLEKPGVSVMKAADVGDQVVGLTTRVLKLPFKIVEPVLPGEQKEP
jgi:AsmA-like C-terminal region